MEKTSLTEYIVEALKRKYADKESYDLEDGLIIVSMVSALLFKGYITLSQFRIILRRILGDFTMLKVFFFLEILEKNTALTLWQMCCRIWKKRPSKKERRTKQLHLVLLHGSDFGLIFN